MLTSDDRERYARTRSQGTATPMIRPSRVADTPQSALDGLELAGRVDGLVHHDHRLELAATNLKPAATAGKLLAKGWIEPCSFEITDASTLMK
jgi:hypothetical protein